MTSPSTLVTQDMLDRKGVWSEPTLSPPIAPSDIRRWAIAVYWPETPPRIFWDEEYAKTTRWGGIIAPQDFNPFAWPIERPDYGATNRSATSAGVGQRVMNGGQVDTYGVPMRPGDIITSRTALTGWDERTGRLGLTLFSYRENRWTNQRGEFVKSRVSTAITY